MGTPGVPWSVTKEQIVRALKEEKGRLTYAAKKLDCSYNTLKRRIDADPELIELVDELRHNFVNAMLDAAEDTLYYALSKRGDDLNNALKSTFYILNNKGRERGYTPNNKSDSGETTLDIKAFARIVKEIDSKSPGTKDDRGSVVEAEPFILDQGCSGEQDTIPIELGAEGSIPTITQL